MPRILLLFTTLLSFPYLTYAAEQTSTSSIGHGSALLSSGLSATDYQRSQERAILSEQPNAIQLSADQLYAFFENNKRADHQAALHGAKEFLKMYSNDPRAFQIKEWMDAYEKVLTQIQVDKPSPALSAASSSREQIVSPSYEETKSWIEAQFRNKHVDFDVDWSFRDSLGICCNTRTYHSPRVYIDGCTLNYASAYTYRSIFGRERVYEANVNFAAVDPGSVKPILLANVENMFVVVVEINSSDPGAASYNILENDGSIEVPRKGERIQNNSDNDPSGFLVMTRSPGMAQRLSSAYKRLAQICGGKTSSF